MKPRHVLVTASTSLASAAFVLAACAGGGSSAEAGDAGADAAPSGDDAARPDTGAPAGDAGADAARDAAAKDASATDANGPGEAGADCVFNRDCALALRCECNAGTCACAAGARGTGQNGVDTCTDGNDCASAVCVEGPGGGTFYCSDECASPTDCQGQLPRCEAIAGLGMICVRNP